MVNNPIHIEERPTSPEKLGHGTLKHGRRWVNLAIPDWIFLHIREEAQQHRISMSAVLRRHILASLELEGVEPPDQKGP